MKIHRYFFWIEDNFIEKSGIVDETKIKILKNNIIPLISKKVFVIKVFSK